MIIKDMQAHIKEVDDLMRSVIQQRLPKDWPEDAVGAVVGPLNDWHVFVKSAKLTGLENELLRTQTMCGKTLYFKYANVSFTYAIPVVAI